MCGIAGIIGFPEPIETRAVKIDRMNRAMVHRGPDDDGTFSGTGATLGMRRLAIFDPEHGRQPMMTADKRHVLVFNGAIYNFRELRAELESHGHAFHTQCDTEVLLAALVQWGEKALPRLRGMFAFAWWDNQEQRLLIARDPFGIKPLYYHTATHGGLVFASELNALLVSGLVSTNISPASVSSYLDYLAVPAPATIYRDIFSLRPGQCAVWQEQRLKIKSYWTLHDAYSATDIKSARTKEEFSRGLRHQLEDSVRAHVVADVPVGAFLSGGLDSTCLVALMTRLGGRQLKTFSLGFDEAGYSEADAAAENARYLGTEHHASVLTGDRVAADIEAIVAGLDHPTGDGINTHYVSQAARDGGVTVALSGLGADELFGGYPSFKNVSRMTRWLPVWEKLPRVLREALLQRWDTGTTQQRKLADMLRHGRQPAALALLQRRVFAESTKHALLSPDAGAAYSAHPMESALTEQLSGVDLPAVTSAAELSGYMTDVLLRDSDAMSMRHSLELRVPFVDRPFVTWLARQSSAYKFTPKNPKSALGEALRDLLPPAIHQRSKRGFTPPFAHWMRGQLRPFLEETFSESSVAKSGLFTPPAVLAQWRGFLANNDSREWSRVWSLALLIAFINRPIKASP